MVLGRPFFYQQVAPTGLKAVFLWCWGGLCFYKQVAPLRLKVMFDWKANFNPFFI